MSDLERQAILEADESLKHNHRITHEEVLAEFGLTNADWEEMCPKPAKTPRRNS